MDHLLKILKNFKNFKVYIFQYENFLIYEFNFRHIQNLFELNFQEFLNYMIGFFDFSGF